MTSASLSPNNNIKMTRTNDTHPRQHHGHQHSNPHQPASNTHHGNNRVDSAVSANVSNGELRKFLRKKVFLDSF